MLNNGTLKGYPKAVETEVNDPNLFLQKKCDLLVPCAVEKSIHKDNADKLNCKVVVEGANGPTTYYAEEHLLQRGIICVPDALANGGGVTCSYFEWLKNLDHVAPGRLTKKYEESQKLALIEKLGYQFPEKSPILKELHGATEVDLVYSGLEEIMGEAVRDNWEHALKKNICFRDACLSRAMEKIHEHFEQCGLLMG